MREFFSKNSDANVHKTWQFKLQVELILELPDFTKKSINYSHLTLFGNFWSKSFFWQNHGTFTHQFPYNCRGKMKYFSKKSQECHNWKENRVNRPFLFKPNNHTCINLKNLREKTPILMVCTHGWCWSTRPSWTTKSPHQVLS